MSRYLTKYATEAEFDAVKTSLAAPHVAYVEEDQSCKYIKPGLSCNVGDGVLWDAELQKKLIVDGSTFNTTTYPASRYTPIGIIVKESVNNYSSPIMMSLRWMDPLNPDTGSTTSKYLYASYNIDYGLSYMYNFSNDYFINNDLNDIEIANTIISKCIENIGDSWKTSQTLEEYNNTTYQTSCSPLHMTVWRYYTPGTVQGDWHLISFYKYKGVYDNSNIFFNNFSRLSSTTIDTGNRMMLNVWQNKNNVWEIGVFTNIMAGSYSTSGNPFKSFAFCEL